MLVVGDFLYHSVHGLCRVDAISKKKDAGKERFSYSLVPKVFNRGNLRFNFPAEDLEDSGFHTPISVKEANEILIYFRRGHMVEISQGGEPAPVRSFAEKNKTWELAKSILSCAHDEVEAKEQRRRQLLDRATRGLILELAFVLELPISEIISMVRQSLECTGKIGPLISASLRNAAEV